MVQVRKILNSATDHLPVVTAYNLDLNKVRYKHSITKRSFKNFTKENWNQSLANQDWTGLEECEEVDEMVKKFDENISAALNEVAPIRTFTIRSNHIIGLSDSTKELMKKKDRARGAIKNASNQEINVPKYPLSITQQCQNRDDVSTRADIRKRPCYIGKSTINQKTCISDAINLWNFAPKNSICARL